MTQGRESGGGPTRRRLLRALGLGVGLAYVAPAVAPLSQARASGFSAASFSGPAVRRARPRPAPPPPEFVVAAPDEAALDRIAADGFEVLARNPVAALGVVAARLRAPAGRTLEEARARVSALEPEAELDLNHLYRPDEFTCGPDGCAAFEAIGWAPRGCPARPVIGMIDTAINPAHAALADRDVEVVALDPGERPESARQHGTAVAALLVGRADARTPGLLPDARLVAVDAFHGGRDGDAADAFALVQALDLLIARRVDVVNMSFSGPENRLVARLLDAAREAGVALVAAAGNDGPSAPPAYPAAHPAVLAVTAVDSRLRAFRQGASGAHVAFAAPGVRLWTAASVSGGRQRSGTSYAAPFVAAAVAAARAADPEAGVDEIVARLAEEAIDLGAPGRDPVFGHGLVDASAVCGPEAGPEIFSTASE